MVDVKATIDKDSFVINYLNKNQPVVVTNQLNGIPACEKWNFRYFVDNYGSNEIKISFENENGYQMVSTNLASFIGSFSNIQMNKHGFSRKLDHRF